MTITLGKVAPVAKSPPMTDEEMADMWRRGEPMSAIAAKARRTNGLTVDETRAIVRRLCVLVQKGEAR